MRYVKLANKFLIFIFILNLFQIRHISASINDKDQIFCSVATGELNGIVTDLRTNLPLKDAKITISIGQDTKSTITDQTGRYEFLNLISGDYVATVDAQNYNIATQNVTINPGIKTVSDFALTKKRASLTGKVIDANTNTPVPLVLVTVSDGQRDYSQTTDSNGYYVINDLFIGDYTITASLLNYDDFGPVTISINSDPTVRDFSIAHQTGSITGKIVNNVDKIPLAFVSIVLSDGTNEYRGITDSNGIFTIDNVKSGYYNMTANLEGYGDKQFTNIFIQGSNLAYQDFELVKLSGNLNGTIRDENNNPLKGVSVFLTDGKNNFSGITDSFGRYSFSNITTGIYTLTASLEKYNMKSTTINVTSSSSNIEDITISKLVGKISGTIIDSSNRNPINRAKITASGGIDTYITHSDPSGYYEFNNIAIGKYRLTIESDNYDISYINNVVVTDFGTTTEDVAITYSSGILKGNVISSLAKNNIWNAKIEIMNAYGHYIVNTDQSGNYLMDNIRQGTYKVVASKENYAQNEKNDVIIIAGESTVLNFEIQGISGNINGRITDKDTGLPIGGAYIKMENEDHLITTISDNDGFYAMDYIPVGNYNVNVSAAGYIENSVNNIAVTLGNEASSNIELAKALGTIKGKIINSNDNNPEVALTITAKNIISNETYETLTDANGDYILNNVPNGTYNIIASRGTLNYTFPNQVIIENGGTAPDETWAVNLQNSIQNPMVMGIQRLMTPIIIPETPTAENSNVTQPNVEIVDPDTNYISGTGDPGDKINIAISNGTNLTTDVLDDGTWFINTLPSLLGGDTLVINATDPLTGDASANVNVQIIDADLPSTGEYVDHHLINFIITFLILLSLLYFLAISKKIPK